MSVISRNTLSIIHICHYFGFLPYLGQYMKWISANYNIIINGPQQNSNVRICTPVHLSRDVHLKTERFALSDSIVATQRSWFVRPTQSYQYICWFLENRQLHMSSSVAVGLWSCNYNTLDIYYNTLDIYYKSLGFNGFVVVICSANVNFYK